MLDIATATANILLFLKFFFLYTYYIFYSTSSSAFFSSSFFSYMYSSIYTCNMYLLRSLEGLVYVRDTTIISSSICQNLLSTIQINQPAVNSTKSTTWLLRKNLKSRRSYNWQLCRQVYFQFSSMYMTACTCWYMHDLLNGIMVTAGAVTQTKITQIALSVTQLSCLLLL